MWKNIIIISSILLSIYSCREENDFLEDIFFTEEGTVNKYNVDFNFILHLENIQYETDLRPMRTKNVEEDVVTTRLQNSFRGILLKKLNNCWYLDTIVTAELDPAQSKWNTLYITGVNQIVGKWNVDLRPGEYRLIAVLNPESVKWNPDIYEGMLVKDISHPGDTIPYAFNYKRSIDYSNYGERELNREIFTGVKEFSVTKTGDLHSTSDNSLKIDFFRKVMKFRLMLKDYIPPTAGEDVKFNTTEHYFKTTLRTLDQKGFCEGMNCWGDAFYPKLNPVMKIKFSTTAIGRWYTVKNGDRYFIIRPDNSHIPNMFFLTGAEADGTMDFYLTDIKINTYSGGIIYVYDGTIRGLRILPNGISGVVFRPADIPEIFNEEYPYGKGMLEYLPEEDPAVILDDFCEWNLDK
ncbi:hypothetical protein [Coprobacter tertius]|uniref:Lipoprotein n=1 Tax=Coprobacter tertius TaxID=2944915 RepID=A0ABT1MHU4_9BACT|nr:hypothetical protein [Coprobacter tertius]MCP9612185.1 hypothetical protein [Coprobacter tertius]